MVTCNNDIYPRWTRLHPVVSPLDANERVRSLPHTPLSAHASGFRFSAGYTMISAGIVDFDMLHENLDNSTKSKTKNPNQLPGPSISLSPTPSQSAKKKKNYQTRSVWTK